MRIAGRVTARGALILALLLVVSALPVVAYAPARVHADVLLSSVMSLQNVTLYYWGQNRLLNILPFLASGIRDPQSNLLALLYLASLSSFGLLLLMALFAQRTQRPGGDLVLPVFAALSATYLLGLRPHAIFGVSLGHPEYALALLLAGSAVYLVWFVSIRVAWRLALAAPLVVLAVGLNPSSALVIAVALAGAVVHRGRIAAADAMLFLLTASSFAGWSYVSSLHPGDQYSGFDVGSWGSHIAVVAKTLVEAMSPAFPALVLIAFIGGLVAHRGTSAGERPGPSLEGMLVPLAALAIFTTAWVALFTANTWVQANGLHFRYFIPAVFALVAIAAVAWAGLFRHLGPRLRAGIALPLLAVAVWTAGDRIIPVSEYAVLRSVADVPRPESGLYAGDYWLVWPAVFRDLMAGHEAYGLAVRGEGNREAARREVRQAMKKTGSFAVMCVAEPAEACHWQGERIVGPSRITTISPAAPQALLLTLTR